MNILATSLIGNNVVLNLPNPGVNVYNVTATAAFTFGNGRNQAGEVFPKMDGPIKEHISFLKGRLQDLHKQVMENRRTRIKQNRLESEIRAAELALTYYRKALELEQQIRNF